MKSFHKKIDKKEFCKITLSYKDIHKSSIYIYTAAAGIVKIIYGNGGGAAGSLLNCRRYDRVLNLLAARLGP